MSDREFTVVLVLLMLCLVLGIFVGATISDQTVTSKQWYACEDVCSGGTDAVEDASGKIVCTCEDGATYTLTDDEVRFDR